MCRGHEDIGDQRFPLDLHYWKIVLDAGLKPVLRISNVLQEELGVLQAWSRRNQFYCRQGWQGYSKDNQDLYDFGKGAGELSYVFISPQKHLVDEIWDVDRVEKEGEANQEARVEATRQVGRLLGYPVCCVQHFTSGCETPDAASFLYRSLRGTNGAADSLLNPSLRLVGHYPCSLNCRATAVLHQTILAQVAKIDAEREKVIRAHLKMPLLVLGMSIYQLVPPHRDSDPLTPAPISSDGVVEDERKEDWVHYTSVVSPSEKGLGKRSSDLQELLEGGSQLQLNGGEIRVAGSSCSMDLRHFCLQPVLLAWDGKSLKNRPIRISVLDFQRSAEDFQGSLGLQLLVGELRSAGYPAQLYRVVVGASAELHNQQQQKRVLRRLQEDGSDVVLFSKHLSSDLPQRFRGEGMCAVLLNDVRPEATPNDQEDNRFCYDACLNATDLRNLESLIRCWELYGCLESWISKPSLGRDSGADRISRFVPAWSFVDVDTDQEIFFRRVALKKNPGCPYRADARANPVFDGLDLSPPEIQPLGCSFCAKGGDYQQSIVGLPDLQAQQMLYFLRGGSCREFILQDETAFDTLGTLLRCMEERGVRGVTLLLRARMQGLLRGSGGRWRGRLDRARKLEVVLNCHLLGIENFCDEELARFNKGLCQDEVVAGLVRLEQLGADYPGTFTYTRYPSHGFILFTPWTSWENLRTNQHFFKRFGFQRISAKAPHNRLRLHSWQPLYALARKDGLLSGAEATPFYQRQIGYDEGEHPWRFKNPDVELCFGLVASAVAQLPGASSRAYDVLDRALDYVDGCRDELQENLTDVAWGRHRQQFFDSLQNLLSEHHRQRCQSERNNFSRSESESELARSALARSESREPLLQQIKADLQRLFAKIGVDNWFVAHCSWSEGGYLVEIEGVRSPNLKVLFEARDDTVPAYAHVGSWNVKYKEPKKSLNRSQRGMMDLLVRWIQRRGGDWTLPSVR